MHTTDISEDVRHALSGSLALVEERRMLIVDRVRENLAAQEADDEPFGQADVTGMMLVNMLLECARDIADGRELYNLDLVVKEHRRLEINDRHYSRFGMLLGPVLREIAGLSPRIASAWCDAYWIVVREMVGTIEIETPARLRNIRGL